MKKLLISIFSLLFVLTISAQNRDISDIMYGADNAFKEKNYYGAAKLYEEVLKENSQMYDVIWKIAESYRIDNDYINAAKYYKILTDKEDKKYPDAVYCYAQMLKSNEEFLRAQYFFKKYLEASQFADFKGNETYVENSLTEILNCEYAWKQQNNPQAVSIKRADTTLNSVYSEFAASLADNKILFSSIRPNIDSLNNYRSLIYVADSINAAKSSVFEAVKSIENFDISNPCMSRDGGKIYFSITENYSQGNTYIYESRFENGTWTLPEKLPEKINYPGYNSTQPFLLERENRTSVFLWSSDRPDGEGGFDIYQCEILPDGTWGIVRNVGRPIIIDDRFLNFTDTSSIVNTAGDEITPFYNPLDSILYFSSTSYQNMGGFDIFAVKGNFRVWETPTNLGYPINSAQNDFYYKLYQREGIAFLTSNRKSAMANTHQSCCNDIFYYNIEPFVSENEKKEKEEEMRIITLTERTKLLVPISLYFDNDRPNPNTWDTVTSQNYSTTYFDYLKLRDVYRKEFSKGLEKYQKMSAVDSVDYYFSYFVEENYNKLLEFTELMKELLSANRKIVVTIKGYTSPLNTVEYNNNLAKRRISSLVNFFAEYESGFFIPYIESGMIEYEFVAFGKTKADRSVSDDRGDLRNSVYSPAASRERRIEIIAVEIDNQ